MTNVFSAQVPPKFAILVLPGARMSSVGAAVDALRSINRGYLFSMFRDRALLGVDHITVSVDGGPVRLAHGDMFVTNSSIEEIAEARGIFVANFDQADNDCEVTERCNRAASRWLLDMYGGGSVVAASAAAAPFAARICAERSGLVALPYPAQAAFRRHRADVHLAPEDSVAEHRRLITAGTVSRELEMLCRFFNSSMSSAAAQWYARQTGIAISNEDVPSLDDIECHDPLVARAQRWLRDRYWQPVSVKDAAIQAAVSERTLTRRFKKSLGTAPHQFLMEVRIDAAKKLLARTQLSVAEVASLVGYPDLRHFRQVFAHHAGRSPARFRRDLPDFSTA